MTNSCNHLDCIYYAFGECLSTDECTGEAPITQIPEDTNKEINYLIDPNSINDFFDEEDFGIDEEFNDLNI